VRIELQLDGRVEDIRVPDGSLLNLLSPIDCCEFHDPEAALAATAEDCADFLSGASRVLVIVNDYTRPTPNDLILAAIEPLLTERDPVYLVASGTHRPPRESEYQHIFGPAFFDRNRSRVRYHDAASRDGLYLVGRTGFGTDVWLNRELHRSDRVIAINSIEPHYFAGFTGGRKGFLPGIAGSATIAHNHNMVTHPQSLPFGLAGNPVHEDMTEAARMVTRPVFSIQLVQDRNHRLLAVRSGDLFSSFDRACADARRVFAVPVRQRADIILSVLRAPYDINFYQSQRAVEFARSALKSPSVQITVSACRDGVGNDGFVRCFAGCNAPADVLARMDEAAFGWHKSARLAQIMQSTDLYTVMDGVPDEAIRSVFMTPFRTVQQALDTAYSRLGADAKLYIIPDAGSVVPVVTH
jgi:nickel-dependent lactate racemase